MHPPPTIQQDNGTLRLAGAFDIYASAQLCTALQSFLRDDGAAVIDLREVADCDTTCIQLLISARRTAASAGCSLEVICSPSVESCRVRLGLHEAS